MSTTVSVILIVTADASDPRPAVSSVRNQSVPDWELILVDCSGDGEPQAQCRRSWIADSRISSLRLGGEYSPSAARNAGIAHAIGLAVAYISPDDLFYPDYFRNALRHLEKSDVLLSAYDRTWEDDSGSTDFVTCDPGASRSTLFMNCPALMLGVAHRRGLWSTLGGYNELLWYDEDWDFLKRAARSGASFRYIPNRSGARRQQVRSEDLPGPTKRQREGVESNFQAGFRGHHTQL
jgi:glycosyltransferase involved in cell wall biosynthesis